MPKEIPSAMLYVKGMAKIAIYAGIASTGSVKLIPDTELNIRKPTMTNAGAVAKAGIAIKIGDKNRAIMKRTAIVIAVRPVLPPSDTPDALSTYDVVVDTPKHAPAVVATASAIKAPLIRGNFPSESSIFAFDETPTNVPNVSKISTKRNANKTTRKFKLINCEKSSCRKIGEISTGTKEANPLEKSGNVLKAPIVGSGL